MRKARLVANLVAFLGLTAGLVAYGFLDLLGNPLQHPVVVSSVFPEAAGLEPNFGVVLDGVVVGSVQSVSLQPTGVRVYIALKNGVEVPSDVDASIGLANDLGEQQLQLTPVGHGSTAPLRNGAVIPAAPDGVPVQVGSVIDTTTNLLKAIGPRSLNSLLATLSTGLDGRAADLQSILNSSREFSDDMLTYQNQFKALLSDAPPVLNGLANDGATLRSDLAQTEVLANVLEQHRSDLVSLLNNGASAATVASELLDGTRANLACFIHDFSDLSANLAQPQNLSNLATGLATNEWFFGAVDAISPTGPSKSLYAGDPSTDNQEWLRTRLLIPPGQPPADEYAQPTQLPASLPGAACDTEFGPGVGPASQTIPQIPVGPMKTDPPTAAAAEVRGGGDPKGSTGSSGSDSAPHVPSTGGSSTAGGLGAMLAGGACLALLLARAARRHRNGPGGALTPTIVRVPVAKRKEKP